MQKEYVVLFGGELLMVTLWFSYKYPLKTFFTSDIILQFIHADISRSSSKIVTEASYCFPNFFHSPLLINMLFPMTDNAMIPIPVEVSSDPGVRFSL